MSSKNNNEYQLLLCFCTQKYSKDDRFSIWSEACFFVDLCNFFFHVNVLFTLCTSHKNLPNICDIPIEYLWSLNLSATYTFATSYLTNENKHNKSTNFVSIAILNVRSATTLQTNNNKAHSVPNKSLAYILH